MLKRIQKFLVVLSVGCCAGWLLPASAQQVSDKHATKEAKRLFQRLYTLQSQYRIFGHQDALAYGVGWKGIPGKSDVATVVGEHPGMMGWDIGHLELDAAKNLDDVPFDSMKQYIRQGHAAGSVITISWHLRNPLTGGSAWDTTHGTVASILPGGSKHAVFNSWLDKVAVFMQDLKDDNGRYIPVLFRPFHEVTGNWFWWCKNNATAADIQQLWRYTVQYLREQKKLHHLLYVYNTAEFADAQAFLQYYPGDDVVDVMSFDQYQHEPVAQKQQFIQSMQQRVQVLCATAQSHKKIAALAETGMEAVPDPQWWTTVLLPIVERYPLSYVLVWRNHGYMASTGKMHYYGPYAGQVSAADFLRFYQHPVMLFQQKLANQKVNKRKR